MACLGALGATDTAILGRSDWLFYSREWPVPDEAPSHDETLRSLSRLGRILADNQVALGVVLVPTKARIYPDFLPESHRLAGTLKARYATALDGLRRRGLHTVDLETAFLTHPGRLGDTPLFYRLDSHWSQSGALLAARTLAIAWSRDTPFGQVLTQAPATPFEITHTTRKRPSLGRDLVGMLAPGTPTPTPEEVRPIVVTRKPDSNLPLLGQAQAPAIALVGSSYSKDWTGFADYLRHALQRDLVNHSIDATQGPWVAVMRYLRDGSYQSPGVRAVIMELPERDIYAGPDYGFRESRYRYRLDDWPLQAAAWAQRECGQGSRAAWRVVPSSHSGRVEVHTDRVVWHRGRSDDALELEWSGALPRWDYVHATVKAAGATQIELERVVDGASHKEVWRIGTEPEGGVLRSPLTYADKAVQRLRVKAPGAARVELHGLQPCRHPRDYLAVE